MATRTFSSTTSSRAVQMHYVDLPGWSSDADESEMVKWLCKPEIEGTFSLKFRSKRIIMSDSTVNEFFTRYRFSDENTAMLFKLRFYNA